MLTLPILREVKEGLLHHCTGKKTVGICIVEIGRHPDSGHCGPLGLGLVALAKSPCASHANEIAWA